jgi:hypothetical protein
MNIATLSARILIGSKPKYVGISNEEVAAETRYLIDERLGLLGAFRGATLAQMNLAMADARAWTDKQQTNKQIK